jgi:hypothetical protein
MRHVVVKPPNRVLPLFRFRHRLLPPVFMPAGADDEDGDGGGGDDDATAQPWPRWRKPPEAGLP